MVVVVSATLPCLEPSLGMPPPVVLSVIPGDVPAAVEPAVGVVPGVVLGVMVVRDAPREQITLSLTAATHGPCGDKAVESR